MTSSISSLTQILPQPRDDGENEEVRAQKYTNVTRVPGSENLDERQLLIKVSRVDTPCSSHAHQCKHRGPPPYPLRTGWRPRAAEDFGDGGAFPELAVAQYPLDMGRNATANSNTIAIQVDAEGRVKYDAIARQGHNEKRIVHATFKDLIPLRQRADVGDISLDRPSEQEVAQQTERTKDALAKLVSGAVAAQKPKNVKGTTRNEPTYVRYTPANQMGDTSQKNDRIMKM